LGTRCQYTLSSIQSTWINSQHLYCCNLDDTWYQSWSWRVYQPIAVRWH
jgi:hypothetical protein